MIEEAVKKIEEEMKNGDSYIKAIGDYVIKNIGVNIDAAKEINEGKLTLKGAMNDIKKIAKSKAVNGCAVMADEEVFSLVAKYYSFNNIQEKIKIDEDKNQGNVVNIEEVKAKKKFSVSLDDLL